MEGGGCDLPLPAPACLPACLAFRARPPLSGNPSPTPPPQPQYTAAARGGSAPEAGHCSASLSLQVQLPWRLGVQLLGPPATHTLLAGSPAGPVTTAGAAAPGSADSELQEQQRRLAGLSTQDSGASPQQAQQAAAAFASELVAGEGRDLSVLLLRSLPPRLVLPAGQRCTALVHFSSQMQAETAQLKAFLFASLYRHARVQETMERAAQVVRDLFTAYANDPAAMQVGADTVWVGADLHRRVADYIAGMTDRFASREHQRLTGLTLLT